MYGSRLAISKFTPTSGETALPAAFFSEKDNKEFIWTDLNNNQTHQSNEYDRVTAINPYGSHIVPDAAGNVWRLNGDAGIRYFPVKGIDASGNPMYSYATSTLFSNPSGLYDVKRIEYDVKTGDLFVIGINLQSIQNLWWCAGNTLAKYSNYLANPNAAPTWSVSLPYLPVTDDNIKAFCIAGDYVFTVATKEGKVIVRKKLDGTIVGHILPNASTGFRSGWTDINGAISAHKRSNGEYLIFVEENGFGKIMMYRWTPTGPVTETNNTLVSNTNSLTFSAAASAQTLAITSNIAWTITGIPTWLSLNNAAQTGNANVTATILANNTGVNRTATLTLSGGTITKTITVTQKFIDNIAPTAVLGITESRITPFGFNLNWDISTDNVMVTGYQIFNNGNLLTTTTGNNCILKNLTPSTTYNITIKAIDAAGNTSVVSATKAVSTIAITYPYITARGDDGPNYDSKAGAFDNDLNTKWYDFGEKSWIQIQYATPVVFNKYVFYNCGDNLMRYPSDWTLQASNDGTNWITLNTQRDRTSVNNTFTFGNTTAYRYYRFDITKNNGENAIELCDIRFSNEPVTVDTQAPTVPLSLTASGITQNSVNLEWDASTDNVAVTAYEVFKNGVLIGTSTTNSLAVSALTCNSTYTFTVKAKDVSGNTSAASVGLILNTASCNPCATLLPLASPIDDYSSGTVIKQANASTGKITATNKITNTANVTYQAGKSIVLEPGFKANAGTVFKVQLGGCN